MYLTISFPKKTIKIRKIGRMGLLFCASINLTPFASSGSHLCLLCPLQFMHIVCFSCISDLRNTSQYTRGMLTVLLCGMQVLVICFILCSFIYGGIAVMGYLMFGDDLQSQVTLNLPQGRPVSHLAICITLVNPFAKYALSIMPIAVALEEFLPRSAAGYRKDVVFWGTIMRTLLVMSTVVVAISLPFFGLLMAFIGSFLGVAVSIHLPCICYVKIYGWRVTKKELALIMFVVILGLFVGVLGTYFSVKAIVGNL